MFVIYAANGSILGDDTRISVAVVRLKRFSVVWADSWAEDVTLDFERNGSSW